VAVNFWASWCSPCRHEFPLLRSALGRHHASRLVVVGISYMDIASDARHFAADEHATWPLLFDDSGVAARAYGVDRVPQTFFIGPDGVLVSRLFGIASRRDLDHELHRIGAA
jgi:cytochrome c biogenesis protein CcmG/thiol:disulfide interchange protein DsbE